MRIPLPQWKAGMAREECWQRYIVHHHRFAFPGSKIGLGGRASPGRRQRRCHLDRQSSRGWSPEVADREVARSRMNAQLKRLRIGHGRRPRWGEPAEPEGEPEGSKAGQQGLTGLGSRAPRKNCGRFRQEISGRRRFLWKSQLLFYSLPADFQQVFTARHRFGQGSLPIG